MRGGDTKQALTAKKLLEELDKDFPGAAGDAGTAQMLKAFAVLNSGIDPELSPVLQVIGLHEHFSDADWVTNILGLIQEVKDLDSPEARNIIDRVTRCFQILENAGLCIDESANIWDNLYRLHPALRGCLARMYPPSEDVKRWFARYLAYEEQEVHNDAMQRGGMFSYHEANFFHAKTLAEKLDMREEDLFLTWGLAIYARDRSRTALAEERYKEMAEKAHQYGYFDKENRAYRQLSNLAKDPESKRFWSQKAADMWSGADELSADAYSTLGTNALRQGNLSTAEQCYKQALAICEQNNEWTKGVAFYGVLGGLAQLRRDAESAKEWYQKQWEKAKDLGDTKTQANASLGLGRIAAEQSDVQEAWERYWEALEIYQALQNSEQVADTLNDMGQLFIDVGAYDAAKEMLRQSVQIAERIGHVQRAAANYNTLGNLSFKQDDFISAKIWFEKAASMFETIGHAESAAVARSNLKIATAKLNGGN